MKWQTSLKQNVAGTSPATETVILSGQQIDYIDRVSHDINPEMHQLFGWPHAIRTILDRFEASGIDFTGANSEEEIAQIGARLLNAKSRRRLQRGPSGTLCASGSSRSAVRPACRSILPEKDLRRSGRPPRSGRE